MKYRTVTAYLVLIVSLLALLVFLVISQRSLRDAQADRDGWLTERAELEASLVDCTDARNELEARFGSRERELLSTIQAQTDERIELMRQLEDAGARIAELERRESELGGQIDRLTSQNTALDGIKTELGEKLAAVKAEIASRAAESSKLQETLTALRGLVDEFGTRLAQSEKALLAGIEELKTLEKSNGVLSVEVTRLNGELRTTAAELRESRLLAERYRVEREKLTLELETLRARVAATGTDGGARGAGKRSGDGGSDGSTGGEEKRSDGDPPSGNGGKIDARVAAVDEREGLVVINAGSKAGVEIGMLFRIVDSGGQEVATVRAARVAPEYTGCEVATRTPGVAIEKGLQVVSR